LLIPTTLRDDWVSETRKHYEFFYISKQLPNDWTEQDYIKTEKPMLISIILFAICYGLINYSIFGGGKVDLVEKNMEK